MTKIFTVGLSGVYDEAAEALTRCNTAEERDFVEAAIAGIKAIRHIGEKFTAEARRRLETETDADTIRCLQKIAETADRVPWNPPQTFYEGVAALAFMRKAIGSIEGYGYNSMGRPDLLLAPLMEKDRAAGVSDAELYDLMCRFMLIWDCHVDHTKIMLGYSEYEYENAITIGGVDSDGNEVFNDVTKMFVESALELDLIYPKLMCRFGSASSDAYLKLISKPLLRSKNIFLFENDDTMIPAQMAAGYTLQQARNYVVSGCWDTAVTDYNKVSTGEYLNLLRAMEWSVHMPADRLTANHLTFRPITDAKSFDDVYDIFLANAAEVIRLKARLNAKGGTIWKEISPLCYISADGESAEKSARSVKRGNGLCARTDELRRVPGRCRFSACHPENVLRETILHPCRTRRAVPIRLAERRTPTDCRELSGIRRRLRGIQRPCGEAQYRPVPDYERSSDPVRRSIQDRLLHVYRSALVGQEDRRNTERTSCRLLHRTRHHTDETP